MPAQPIALAVGDRVTTITTDKKIAGIAKYQGEKKGKLVLLHADGRTTEEPRKKVWRIEKGGEAPMIAHVVSGARMVWDPEKNQMVNARDALQAAAGKRAAGLNACPRCGGETDTDFKTTTDAERNPTQVKIRFCKNPKCGWEAELCDDCGLPLDPDIPVEDDTKHEKCSHPAIEHREQDDDGKRERDGHTYRHRDTRSGEYSQGASRVGRSLRADRRQLAQTVAKPGYGDKGDLEGKRGHGDAPSNGGSACCGATMVTVRGKRACGSCFSTTGKREERVTIEVFAENDEAGHKTFQVEGAGREEALTNALLHLGYSWDITEGKRAQGGPLTPVCGLKGCGGSLTGFEGDGKTHYACDKCGRIDGPIKLVPGDEGKREVRDRHYVHRDTRSGEYAQGASRIGRSLRADRRELAQTVAKPGYGDKGDLEGKRDALGEDCPSCGRNRLQRNPVGTMFCGRCGYSRSSASAAEGKHEMADEGAWWPANSGKEEPFRTRTGRNLLYCWNPSLRMHAYVDIDRDMVLSNEEAMEAIQG